MRGTTVVKKVIADTSSLDHWRWWNVTSFTSDPMRMVVGTVYMVCMLNVLCSIHGASRQGRKNCFKLKKNYCWSLLTTQEQMGLIICINSFLNSFLLLTNCRILLQRGEDRFPPSSDITYSTLLHVISYSAEGLPLQGALHVRQVPGKRSPDLYGEFP